MEESSYLNPGEETLVVIIGVKLLPHVLQQMGEWFRRASRLSCQPTEPQSCHDTTKLSSHRWVADKVWGDSGAAQGSCACVKAGGTTRWKCCRSFCSVESCWEAWAAAAMRSRAS